MSNMKKIIDEVFEIKNDSAKKVLFAKLKWEAAFTRTKVVEEVIEMLNGVPQEKWLKKLEQFRIVNAEIEQEAMVEFQRRSDVANALGLI